MDAAACNAYRADWLELALDARAGRTRPGDLSAAHADACDACAAWTARRTDHVAALASLTPVSAPAELDEAVAAALVPGAGGRANPFGERLRHRLAALPRHQAPSVLDRLVAEELADPAAARARRFAGDLDRPAVPGALERRLRRVVDAPDAPASLRGRLWPVLSAVAATAAAAIILLAIRPDRETPRPFQVHYGRPPVSSPLATGLADGWTGGILAAGGEAVVEGPR